MVVMTIILVSLGLPFAMGFGNQNAYNANPGATNYAVVYESEIDESVPEEYVAQHVYPSSYEIAPSMPENELEALILEIQEQIGELQFNVQLLWAIISDEQVDDEVLRRQAAQSVATERLMLQIEYYNVTALLSGTELLKHNIALAERHLGVERTRLSLGETTQMSVDLVYAELNALNRQREISEKTFRVRRQWIDQSLGLPGYDFIRDYTVPVPASPQANSLSALKTGLMNYDLSLYIVDRQIAQQNEFLAELIDTDSDIEIIEAVKVEISRLNAEREALRNQLELAATNRWLAYQEAKVQHDLAVTMRPALTARLELISLMYDLGEISTVERLSLEAEVYEELHNMNLAAIALAIIVAELDVMAVGVIMQSS